VGASLSQHHRVTGKRYTASIGGMASERVHKLCWDQTRMPV
jgi:hypothetical protein